MLGRLILVILQLAVGYFGTNYIRGVLPSLWPPIDIFIYAIVVALLVTVVGFAGSLVLQGVGTPTTGTLTSALIFALIFAALTLVEPVTAFVSSISPGIPRPSIRWSAPFWATSSSADTTGNVTELPMGVGGSRVSRYFYSNPSEGGNAERGMVRSFRTRLPPGTQRT